MALAASGALSLNDIHVEAGGTSGTEVSLNDADIRRFRNLSSGATNDMNSFHGLARILVTSGYSSPYLGYRTASSIGSVSQGLSWTSATWSGLYYSSGNYTLNLGGTGSGVNSGFTSMLLYTSSALQVLARTSATFNGSSNTYSAWVWSTAMNMFTNGTVVTVHFF